MKTTWDLNGPSTANKHLNEDICKKIVAQSEGHIEFFSNSSDFVKFSMRMDEIVIIEKKARLQFDNYTSKFNYNLGNSSNFSSHGRKSNVMIH